MLNLIYAAPYLCCTLFMLHLIDTAPYLCCTIILLFYVSLHPYLSVCLSLYPCVVAYHQSVTTGLQSPLKESSPLLQSNRSPEEASLDIRVRLQAIVSQ